SLFPPYPSVIQGAIRSHHLVVKDVDLRDRKQIEATVGTANDYRTLCMRGPFLAKKEGDKVIRYLPVPAHAVPGKEGYIAPTPRNQPDTVKTSAPTPMLLWSNEEPQKKEFGQWLREDRLCELLKLGAKSAVVGESEANLFARESRLGIARDDTRRTTEEGALYEVEFIRLHDHVGLFIEVEGYDGWPQSGIMRIGGEGRGARFEEVKAEPWPAPSGSLPGRFLIYFATPTYFAQGWHPDSWQRFFEGEVTLQTAAVNRFQSLGGFDWAKNDHKPARRYVPAGSVYFFTSDGHARLKPGLTQNAITDAGAEIGFGQILIGEW
ncbi:MAG TPA: type III-B CRISPR module-associated protein Cmr3, partial [Methylomirabilota bacterium]|nr:type III-B CRISPR module-associated protein Cmr3 [Methylomirabilota bacterium]